MARILFSLATGIDGEIQLRDNKFMDFWKMVFSRHKRLLSLRSDKPVVKVVEKFSYTDMDTVIRDNFIHNKPLHSENVLIVNAAIESIISKGYDWSCGYLNEASGTTDCNRIHRGFTTYMLTKSTDSLGISTDNLIKLKYLQPNLNYASLIPFLLRDLNDLLLHPDDIDYSSFETQLEEPLHTINAYVHRIENTSLLSKRWLTVVDAYLASLDNVKQVITPSCEWDSKGPDGCTDITKVDWNFGDLRNTDIYSSDPQYNVYDLKNILGKDYECAYYDYDNPQSWDVTNTFNTTKGGFEIKPWQSLVTRDFVKPWCAEYSVPTEDKFVAPIAIGSIDPRWLREHCMFSSVTDIEDKIITAVDLIE